MEQLFDNKLLKIPPNVKHELRRLHNLDKPGRLEEAIDILEKWIQKQDHILKKDFTRHYLELVLITCKGSVEKAKKQIDRLCTMKTLLPQFFMKTNVKIEMGELMNYASLFPLPNLTRDYYRIMMLKANDKNFLNHFFEYFQGAIVLCEYLKRNDYCNGFVFVNDLRQLSILDLATKLNTVELQQFLSIVIEGFGTRVKGIHLLTHSTAVDVLVKLMKHFLSNKIGRRIHVHKTIEELQAAVPKELLPADYGGNEMSAEDLASCEKDTQLNDLYDDLILHNLKMKAISNHGAVPVDWLDELSSPDHVEYLKMMREARTDENLRRTDQFNEEYMGTPGSFRILNVD